MPVERGADGKRDLHVLADDAVGRRGDGEQIEIWQACLGANRYGKNRHAAQAVFLRRADRWLAEVEIAVAEKDDGTEVVFLFQEAFQRLAEVGAVEPFTGRGGEGAGDEIIRTAGAQRSP